MGHGKRAVVGKREKGLLDSKGLKQVSCLSVKQEGRLAARIVHYLDIGPANSFGVSQSDGLEKGFFGGEAKGKAFGRPELTAAAADFAFGENSAQKKITPSGHEALDSLDIDDIYSRSDDHNAGIEGFKGSGGGAFLRFSLAPGPPGPLNPCYLMRATISRTA